jgi:hypothetical protein
LRDRSPVDDSEFDALTSPIEVSLADVREHFVRALVEGGMSERTALMLGDWIDITATARLQQMSIESMRAHIGSRP